MVVEGLQNRAQQKPQPADEEPEVISGCSQDGVDGIACTVSEVVASHSVLGFEMSYNGFDC